MLSIKKKQHTKNLVLGEYLEEINGVNLYYEIAGNPQGPVVLIMHGNPGINSYPYKQIFGKELEKELCLIYLDQRGMGRSECLKEDTSFSIKVIAEDMEMLRKKLNIDKWIIFGHSAGVFYSYQYVKKHLDHVQGLILVDGGFKGPGLLTALKILTGKYEQRLFYDKNKSKELKHIVYKEGPPYVQGLSDKLMWDFFWFNAGKHLKSINVPTLIITGKYSKIYGFKKQSLTMHNKIKNSKLLIFEKSGHFPFFEEKKRFVKEVLNFTEKYF